MTIRATSSPTVGPISPSPLIDGPTTDEPHRNHPGWHRNRNTLQKTPLTQLHTDSFTSRALSNGPIHRKEGRQLSGRSSRILLHAGHPQRSLQLHRFPLQIQHNRMPIAYPRPKHLHLHRRNENRTTLSMDVEREKDGIRVEISGRLSNLRIERNQRHLLDTYSVD